MIKHTFSVVHNDLVLRDLKKYRWARDEMDGHRGTILTCTDTNVFISKKDYVYHIFIK